jgi:hypothetical protein
MKELVLLVTTIWYQKRKDNQNGCLFSLNLMVIREGLEPSTQWLKAICSTD